MKSVPSVMMNDGSFVTFTSSPLMTPVSRREHGREAHRRPERPAQAARVRR